MIVLSCWILLLCLIDVSGFNHFRGVVIVNDSPARQKQQSGSRFSTARVGVVVRGAQGGGGDDNGGDDKEQIEDGNTLLGRFLNPKIDDVGLPLADALIAGIVAPVSVVFVCGVQRYSPTWLVATLPPTSALNNALRLFPATLSHGALLAGCWLLGALASKSFEKEAFGKDFSVVLTRVLAGGAFASGLLVLLTQADLFIEYGRWVQGGESPEIDLRLLKAFAELALDISVEAAWMLFWRIYRASITTV
ncbi:hypothetical protein TrVE_jg8444 [Triparma verrucosa]|uniref:Transmembrane protein n=1 Tax=Triparma verrucosa TaxID=1606542 RepID=A0A9W7EZW6_9STRA|nr:hypothetical protein TrVE_jg8444 [Triparma verrucosa]